MIDHLRTATVRATTWWADVAVPQTNPSGNRRIVIAAEGTQGSRIRSSGAVCALISARRLSRVPILAAPGQTARAPAPATSG